MSGFGGSQVKSVAGKMRSNRGQQTAEFGAAIVILVTCIFVPMIDLAIVPVRYGLAQNIVASYARKLGLSEKFSQAVAESQSDDLKDQLLKLGGVRLKQIDVQMVAASSKDEGAQTAADRPGGLGRDWLPDGSRCPCNYSLEVKVICGIEPLILLNIGGSAVTGLNAPFKTTLLGRSQWENLGRNPASGEFYLNE